MLQKISNHLENLLPREAAIRRQFEISEEEIENELTDNYDPLLEKHYEAAPGLIHKYGNRVLCLLTSECAAYCRFCTRKRLVSDIELGKVSAEIIDVWVNYLNNHREVSEVIVSGGDPFTVDDELFDYALSSLVGVCSVNVLRVGTRVPVSEPSLVTPKKLDTIRRITKPVYIGIHFEHPSEITCPTICCAKRLRQAGAILYSQSVFLKGVNDDFDTLRSLFSKLVEIGVRPFYIYHCDPVPGAAHFIVDIEKERRIMTRLRSELSGLACPLHVIDAPDGSGKIPVPLEFWDCDIDSYTDFNGDSHETQT